MAVTDAEARILIEKLEVELRNADLTDDDRWRFALDRGDPERDPDWAPGRTAWIILIFEGLHDVKPGKTFKWTQRYSPAFLEDVKPGIIIKAVLADWDRQKTEALSQGDKSAA